MHVKTRFAVSSGSDGQQRKGFAFGEHSTQQHHGSFSRSANQTRLLRFLIKQADYNKESLKETYIGTVFYSRPATYDPQVDTIVRVNVSRLRTRLQEYYETEGRNDPVRIVIPVDSYVPELIFVNEAVSGVSNATEPERVNADAAATTTDNRHSRWMQPRLLRGLAGLLVAGASALLIVRFAGIRSSQRVVQLKQKWILTPGQETEIAPAFPA